MHKKNKDSASPNPANPEDLILYLNKRTSSITAFYFSEADLETTNREIKPGYYLALDNEVYYLLNDYKKHDLKLINDSQIKSLLK